MGMMVGRNCSEIKLLTGENVRIKMPSKIPVFRPGITESPIVVGIFANVEKIDYSLAEDGWHWDNDQTISPPRLASLSDIGWADKRGVSGIHAARTRGKAETELGKESPTVLGRGFEKWCCLARRPA
jgi:hypothetical protein